MVGILLLIAVCFQIVNDFRRSLLEEDTVELSERGDDLEEEEDLFEDNHLFLSLDKYLECKSNNELEYSGLKDYVPVYIKILIPPPELV
ncbi:MAG: hypothetical protein MK066_03415 [Crocinitomicaceae bacterium]|nr:hypothetical protein [Crocinitomicaceae bacterium]